MKFKTNFPGGDFLRKKAEKLLTKNSSEAGTQPSEAETPNLVHEIEVQKIELELQNKDLRHAWAMAEVAAARYSKLYDFSPTGYLSLSKEGKITEINLYAAKVLGKQRLHLQGAYFGIFVSDNTRPIFNTFLEKTFSGNVEKTCEITISANGNSSAFINLTGITIDNGEQCLVHLVDITESKLKEAEIKTILKTTMDGFYLVDMEGRFLDTNDSYCKMIGYTRDEILRMGVKDVDVIDTQEIINSRILRILKNGYERFETRHRRKDGRVIDVEASVNLLVKEKPELFCFMRDISDRKLADEALRERESELRETIATKDKFFSILAHDLRNPFNSLLGFTQLMDEELSTMSTEEIQKVVRSIRNSTTNLYSLLENLLEWSRLQRGLTTFSPELFLLLPNINSSLAMTRELATTKDIQIIIDIPPDLSVFADEKMFDSILRNLSTNAVKFTPKGGMITVAAKPGQENWVEFSVKDTGVGISREMAENLLHQNEKSNRLGTNNEPGTGLGLNICKEFIEKHGGRFWAVSEESKGSTFYFTLPVDPRFSH